MVFDYGTLLSPDPIKLSIGTLRKPKLQEIYMLSFERFNYFESFLKLTPDIVFRTIYSKERLEYWNSLSETDKQSITMYSIILNDANIRSVYTELFDFFFIEKVIFKNGYFLLLNDGVIPQDEITPNEIRGAITENTFQEVIEMIQQICCIFEKPKPSIDEMKFKNGIARKMYEKMLKAQEEQDKQKPKRANKDHTMSNIISAVSNRHPSLNPITIWEMTVFQLIDSFNRLQVNAVYDINQTRVSVWGDEKKTFDSTLWYKNNNDT